MYTVGSSSQSSVAPAAYCVSDLSWPTYSAVPTSDLKCCFSGSSRLSAPSLSHFPTVFEPGATVMFHSDLSNCFLPSKSNQQPTPVCVSDRASRESLQRSRTWGSKHSVFPCQCRLLDLCCCRRIDSQRTHLFRRRFFVELMPFKTEVREIKTCECRHTSEGCVKTRKTNLHLIGKSIQ